MGTSNYYLGIMIISLAIAIYNLNLSSEASGLQCTQVVQMSYDTYLQYNKTLEAQANRTVRFLQPNTTQYDVRVNATNSYPVFNLLIAIIYLTIMGLSLYMALLISYMSNQLPEDFLNVSWCKRFLACFCKVFPLFIILAHWGAMIFILILWYFLFSKQCDHSISTGILAVAPPTYYNNMFVLNIVNSSVWVALHYGGAIIREMLYQEPFMYMPYFGSKSLFAQICLKKLGP
jgi:hypothetical protein